MTKIRVLLADDHPVVREGIRFLISNDPGIEVIGESADGRDVVEKTLLLCPDVILMDLVMPEMGGLEAIRAIRRTVPAARILVLTSFAEEDKVFPAIKAGALGYLLKDSSPKHLLEAIRAVHRGEASLHPNIAFKLMRELAQPTDLPPTDEPLTEREVVVLQLLAQGLSNREIGERIYISEWTVRTHISNILSKLHLANRTQAALYAVREGILGR